YKVCHALVPDKMKPRLAGSGTFISPVDKQPLPFTQIKTLVRPNDSLESKKNGDDVSINSLADQSIGKNRGSLKLLRPTRFSPPPRHSDNRFNNIILTILFLGVIVL
ncbi:unnamed protein product, partial [Lymnaea stagnalis]